MKHLLAAADLSRDDATAILDNADRFREALIGREVKKLPTLRGRTIITMFYENSTRTRVSFEVAGKWMSADVINVSASGSSVAKGESLRDTAMTLRAAGADALSPHAATVAGIAGPTCGSGSGMVSSKSAAASSLSTSLPFRCATVGGEPSRRASTSLSTATSPSSTSRWNRNAVMIYAVPFSNLRAPRTKSCFLP